MSVLDYPSGSGPLCTNERKKKFIIGGIITTIVVIILIIIICVATKSSARPGSYVLTQVPLVDGYNNLAQLLRRCEQNKLKEFKFDKDLSVDSKWAANETCRTFTDLVRMKKGKLFGQVWYASAFCNASYKDATSIVLEQIDVLKRLFKSYPNDLQLVSTSGGLMDTYKRGKISNFIGVHGGHALDSRIGILRMFYDLGVRFLTFAPCDTPWIDKGINLRDFGKKIIKEANRLGMVLDLTGSQKNVALDVIKETQAPVIYSHTAAWALNNVTKTNIDDDIIRAIKDKNGLIMITFDAPALTENNTDITQLLEHIDHIASTGSLDTVGLGSGFGLFNEPINGVNGTNSYPDIFDALMKYKSKNKSIDWSSMENLKKLASSNFIRVLRDVEMIRDLKQATENPVDDWINIDYLKDIDILGNCSTDPYFGQNTTNTDLFYNASVQSNATVTVTPTTNENNIPEETNNINSEELNPPNPSINATNKIDDLIKIDESDEMNPF